MTYKELVRVIADLNTVSTAMSTAASSPSAILNVVAARVISEALRRHGDALMTLIPDHNITITEEDGGNLTIQTLVNRD